LKIEVKKKIDVMFDCRSGSAMLEPAPGSAAWCNSQKRNHGQSEKRLCHAGFITSAGRDADTQRDFAGRALAFLRLAASTLVTKKKF
jgi:hypothetical protein